VTPSNFHAVPAYSRQVAYKLIKDELALDGNPALNLASFVTTYMEEEAEKLMTENLSKNFIDYEGKNLTAMQESQRVGINLATKTRLIMFWPVLTRSIF
jgi:glutamate/tyrosine decarboxylase-like PLP-dependent enzyme